MVVLNAVNSRVMLDVDPEEPWTMVDNVRGNRVVAFSVYSTVTNGAAALTTPVHVLTPARMAVTRAWVSVCGFAVHAMHAIQLKGESQTQEVTTGKDRNKPFHPH